MADSEAVGLGPLLQDDTDDAASEEAASVSDDRNKTSTKVESDEVKVMEVDPKLPDGWTRKVTQRKSGASAGHYDVYIISPDKTRFRSRTEIAAYIKKFRLKLKAEDFDFSPFGRHVNVKAMRKKGTVKDLVERVKSRAGRSKATKEDKKSTPTLASRLKVKMNFSAGRKRKGAEEEEEKTTPANKRRKVKTPAKEEEEETPKKRGRGRPSKGESAKQTPASKVAATLKKATEKKTPGRGRKRKVTEEKEESEQSSHSEKEEEEAAIEKTESAAEQNTSKLEIQQLDESPRKRRISKRPGRFAEGLTDEEINAPPPKPTPKPPKTATPKTQPKKKAPPKPKRKSVSKPPPETPKRNKEIEDEANLIASLTAQIEKAEALVKEAQSEEQEPDEQPSMERLEDEAEFVSSPETLIRKPNPADNFPADNIWTPKPQSSRYSGRKITPKIRSSPEEEIPTPRKHAGRGRGKNSKLLKRQNSKTNEVGKKRNKVAPPVPPKPRRKSKSDSKSAPIVEPPGHNTTTAHIPAAPPTHKLPDDLLVNSEITEQSYEEFLSAVESGVPDLGADPAAVVAPPKKSSPKAAFVRKQRTISESEIKLGVPIRDDDVIHTPPPTSPLVPSDDHSYSLSSRKYPALSMPPRSQGENGEVAVPRFVASTTAADSHIVSAAVPTTSALSSAESASQGESSEEETLPSQQAQLPAPLQKTQVIIGGLPKRRKSSGEAKSILIRSPTSTIAGQQVTTSEGQSVLAQVLSRPQEYTASKKRPGTSKKLKCGPQQVITQIVSKEGKVVYGGGDGTQLIRMSSGSGGGPVILSQTGARAGGQFAVLKQGDGSKMIVRKVTASGQQQAGFTQLSNITGVNQRVVLASPNKKPAQSLLARVVSAATTESAVVTRILPSAALGGDSSDDGGAVVVTAPTTTGASSGIKFLYAGSSPPRSLSLSTTSQSVVSEMICSESAPTDILASPPSSSLADSAALLQDDLPKQDSSPDEQINRDVANGLENLTQKL